MKCEKCNCDMNKYKHRSKKTQNILDMFWCIKCDAFKVKEKIK